jgi:6-phosphogluconolactonase
MARITAVDIASFAEASAARIAELVERSVANRGVAHMALTGGHTPEVTYAALADPTRPHRDRIDWSRVHLYWGDERHVPPDHPDSNFGMAERTLVGHIPIPAANVHRIRAELPDARSAAAQYERELPNAFDVMLLGLGDDCHIASIFPGSELLSSWGGPRQADDLRPATMEKVAAVFVPHLESWRITLTPPALLGSNAIVMLVTGASKAAAVAAAIDRPPDVTRYPGQLLRAASDRVEWIVDTAAAGRLESR